MAECKSYSDSDASEALGASLPGWRVVDGHLAREYRTSGWRSSMLIANAIGHVAEVAWHHPDLHVSWSSVGVRLRTHSDDAITDKDFELARLIEQTVAWKPSEGGALEGTPKEGTWSYRLDD